MEQRKFIITLFFCFILCIGIVGLIWSFANFNKEGISCLKNPLVYGANFMAKDNQILSCSCVIAYPDGSTGYMSFSNKSISGIKKSINYN